MCGITGELRFDGARANIEAVSAMADAMAPRGPDGSGVWCVDGRALGHRRLKIIDLSDHAAQPMVDPGLGLTIVFNGCIYNYKQLRTELEHAGYRFFSTGDTEVLLKAYHRWGDAFVERLHGMFAFCIVERDTGRVVLGRDRLGIKPLYLASVPGGVRFASTLPALLAGDRAGVIDTGIDPVALHQYLTFHSVVAPPRTILSGVEKLAPATLRVFDADGTPTDTVYWQPQYTRTRAGAFESVGDWESAVLDALRTAVDRRLVADVPVGVLLSGGLDSSLVVGLLAEAGQRGLATFSIGFETVGDIAGDEFRYSDVIADTFETDHHRIRVGAADLVDALDDAVGAMSEPMVSHDAVAFFLLGREVSRHVKVVQSGQGADEVFGGYHWYPPLVDADAPGVDDYARVFFDRSHADMAEVVSDAYRSEMDAARAVVADHFARAGADTVVDRALRLDTEIMLVDDPVKRVDNMTMAWGLEARVPFLDHELVELAAACPPELKLAHDGKGVLKEAARQVIPADVIDRPKGYFPVPGLTHIEEPVLSRLRDTLYAPAAKERGLFRSDYVDTLLADPNGELTPLRGNKLWQLALLEQWLQAHTGSNGGS